MEGHSQYSMSVPIQNPKSHHLQWSANHMHLPFFRAQTIGSHLIILILRRSSKEWDKLMMQIQLLPHVIWGWVISTICDQFKFPKLCGSQKLLGFMNQDYVIYYIILILLCICTIKSIFHDISHTFRCVSDIMGKWFSSLLQNVNSMCVS
jgi:hypothetical protein